MPTIQIEHGLIRCPEIGEPGGVGCILLDGKVTHGDSSGDIQRVELVPKYRIYKKIPSVKSVIIHTCIQACMGGSQVCGQHG